MPESRAGIATGTLRRVHLCPRQGERSRVIRVSGTGSSLTGRAALRRAPTAGRGFEGIDMRSKSTNGQRLVVMIVLTRSEECSFACCDMSMCIPVGVAPWPASSRIRLV